MSAESTAVIEHVAPANDAAITPMSLVQMAVQRGANIDELGKLLDLQMRYEADQARKAYVVALNAFKAAPPQIVKSKAVAFGNTAYKHAKLDNASELIGAALSTHGLSHRWNVEQADGGIIRVTCVLTHILGHSESVTMQASPDTSGSKNSIQAIGSTTSYLQRYTLFAATGLAPKDADDDGNGGNSHKLSDNVRLDFESAIDDIVDKTGWESLWKKIADACSKAGDVESYEALKTAMAKRFKGLPK